MPRNISTKANMWQSIDNLLSLSMTGGVTKLTEILKIRSFSYLNYIMSLLMPFKIYVTSLTCSQISTNECCHNKKVTHYQCQKKNNNGIERFKESIEIQDPYLKHHKLVDK